MTTVSIECQMDEVVLKGELRYWAKDYEVTLREPLVACKGAHLLYNIPLKYVTQISDTPTCKEINILEKSKEILQELYTENRKND